MADPQRDAPVGEIVKALFPASGTAVVPKVAKVALGQTAGNAGVLSWQNPESVGILAAVVIDITTAQSAQTADVGVDGDNSVYYFAVWEGRVAYWTKRSVGTVDYYLWLEDVAQARFAQSGHDLRNRVRTKHLVSGVTTRTAVAHDTASQAAYPIRELTVGQGEVNATNAANARDQALEEQKLPRQQQSLTVKGRVWNVMNGELVEEPKWGVRAGKVVRVQDLVPASVSSPVFDDLRTFYILETEYDAVTDTLKVQPDRPAPKVSSLLARRTPVETRR